MNATPIGNTRRPSREIGRLDTALSSARAVHGENFQPQLADRIERALVLLAYFIELDGDVHIPLYEKFESELEELRKAQATRERARERLARYAKPWRPEGDPFEKR